MRVYAHLSPTISHNLEVRMPPPISLSSSPSPVVNFSSFGSSGSSSLYNLGASASQTASMINFASWCEILHFLMTSDNEVSTRSATVAIFPALTRQHSVWRAVKWVVVPRLSITFCDGESASMLEIDGDSIYTGRYSRVRSLDELPGMMYARDSRGQIADKATAMVVGSRDAFY